MTPSPICSQKWPETMLEELKKTCRWYTISVYAEACTVEVFLGLSSFVDREFLSVVSHSRFVLSMFAVCCINSNNYPRRARSALGVDTVLTLDVCLYVCMFVC